jgi:hypothetical protein
MSKLPSTFVEGKDISLAIAPHWSLVCDKSLGLPEIAARYPESGLSRRLRPTSKRN